MKMAVFLNFYLDPVGTFASALNRSTPAVGQALITSMASSLWLNTERRPIHVDQTTWTDWPGNR